MHVVIVFVVLWGCLGKPLCPASRWVTFLRCLRLLFALYLPSRKDGLPE